MFLLTSDQVQCVDTTQQVYKAADLELCEGEMRRSQLQSFYMNQCLHRDELHINKGNEMKR